MHERLIEMSVGETVLVGCYWVTLLDVEGDELFLQIEPEDDHECDVSLDGETRSLMFA